EMKEKVEPVVGSRIQSRDPEVQQVRHDREGMPIPRDRRGEDGAYGRIPEKRILEDIEGIIPVREAVSETGQVRDECEGENRREPKASRPGPGSGPRAFRSWRARGCLRAGARGQGISLPVVGNRSVL